MVSLLDSRCLFFTLPNFAIRGYGVRVYKLPLTTTVGRFGKNGYPSKQQNKAQVNRPATIFCP